MLKTDKTPWFNRTVAFLQTISVLFRKMLNILWYRNVHVILWERKQSCYKVVASQNLQKRGGGAMGTYEILSLLFLGGTFLVALLTYIDRNNKRK